MPAYQHVLNGAVATTHYELVYYLPDLLQTLLWLLLLLRHALVVASRRPIAVGTVLEQRRPSNAGCTNRNWVI